MFMRTDQMNAFFATQSFMCKNEISSMNTIH